MFFLTTIKKYIITSLTIVFVFGFPFVLLAQENTISSTVSLGSSNTIIAGESLPLNVQLLNFGTPGERVDVTLNFIVRDQDKNIVLQKTETVAVQTTASFVRHFQIPKYLETGVYTLSLLVSYRNQNFPAISEQQFTIEPSILGYGISQWYPALPFALIPFIFTLIIWRRKHRKRDQDLIQRDYGHIPRNERTSYEVIHDIIESIHYHVGDEKIREIVSHISGLTLNESNSHIKEINGSMETIISQLIHEYEGITGRKTNIITHPSYPEKRVQIHQ